MFFSKLTSQRSAMKTTLAAASPLLAFRVHDHPAEETAQPIAPRQKYEKRFTLVAAGDKNKKVAAVAVPSIERLVVSSPGVVFVSFDANATEPTVKVSAEEPEVVEAFDVVARGASGLEVRLKSRLPQRLYVLTEVSLPAAHALRSLDVQGSGTVVVEDNVLPVNDPQAAVAIRLSGSGDVFASCHSDVRVGSLALELSGSGDVQFVAPSVTARDAFETKVSSSGDVRVFVGTLAAPRIVLSTAGSGDMQIAALSLEALRELKATLSGSGSITTIGNSLKLDAVRASIAGSGDVKLVAKEQLVANTMRASVAGSGDVDVASAHARCAEAHLSVAGSGTVDARDLVAHQAVAGVSGSGSILIRSSASIKASTGGSGSVTIVGGLPPHVVGHPRTRTEAEKPSKVDALEAKRVASTASPTRVDAFEKLTRFSGTINVKCFSDFIEAVKVVWNHQKGDNIEVAMKTRSGASKDDRP